MIVISMLPLSYVTSGRCRCFFKFLMKLNIYIFLTNHLNYFGLKFNLIPLCSCNSQEGGSFFSIGTLVSSLQELCKPRRREGRHGLSVCVRNGAFQGGCLELGDEQGRSKYASELGGFQLYLAPFNFSWSYLFWERL